MTIRILVLGHYYLANAMRNIVALTTTKPLPHLLLPARPSDSIDWRPKVLTADMF